jgi:hypothetical protein
MGMGDSLCIICSTASPRHRVTPSPHRSAVPRARSLQALRLRLPNPKLKALILIETKHQVHVTDGLARGAPG